MKVVEGAAARAVAARILADVLAGKTGLPEALARHGDTKLDARDQAFVRELAWGAARMAPRLDALVRAQLRQAPRSRDMDVHALMMIGAYQLGWLDVPAHAGVHATVAATALLGKDWARGLVNAVLRTLSDLDLQTDDLPDAARLGHPEWLLKRLRDAWPEHWRGIVDAGNARPPLTLRARDPDAATAALEAEGYEVRRGILCTEALYVAPAVDPTRLPGFATGELSVQDEGAQWAARLLDAQPGHRVLDACAAPGGKTLHIAQRTPAVRMTALEIDARRGRRVEENMARAGLDIDCRIADATAPESWWDGEPYERILLDAPCTATGIIRRQPDVRLLRREGDIAKLQAAQRALADALWPLLAPGGALVYCTCSVLPEEGPMIVQAFLERHPDARIDPIRTEHPTAITHGPGVQLLPTTDRHDGFFYARLVRAPQRSA